MVSEQNYFLVCGADSLVGQGLIGALNSRGRRTLATTRRKASAVGSRTYMDFEKPDTYELPSGVNYVFVVAAATNYDRCETDPNARKINVFWTPRFVRAALEQGAFVTFISTNSVFGGEMPWPHEDAPHAPGIEYARQKSEAEREIHAVAGDLGALKRLNIVRLTKILSSTTSPLPSWRETWARGGVVEPFSDLIFAPMSVPFVGDALAQIGDARVPGHLHLSGSENVSYVDFAFALAKQWGIDHTLISPTTSGAKGIHIPFKPRFSGLGMLRTHELCGLSPQSLESVIADIRGTPPSND
jgi:dTDP-4-dehydrorhamnose reductase